MRKTYPVAVCLDNTELICPCRGERYKPKVTSRAGGLLVLDFRVIEILPIFSPHAFPNSLGYRQGLALAWLSASFGCLVLIVTDLADQVIESDLKRILEQP